MRHPRTELHPAVCLSAGAHLQRCVVQVMGYECRLEQYVIFPICKNKLADTSISPAGPVPREFLYSTDAAGNMLSGAS